MITKRGKSFSLSKFIEVNSGEEKECRACLKTFSYHFFGTDGSRKDTTNVRCVDCVKNNVKVDKLNHTTKTGVYKKCLSCDKTLDLSLFPERLNREYRFEKICKFCKREGITLKNIRYKEGLKLCLSCNEYKNLEDFNDNNHNTFDRKNCNCKNCHSAIKKRYYYKKPLEERRESKRLEYERNKETYINYAKNRKKSLTEEDLIKIRAYKRKSEKIKRQNDPFFKLKSNIRSLIKISFKRMFEGKRSTSSSTKDIIGIEFDLFMQHIERQFLPWMNWENYGKYNGEKDYGWDLDHIVPVSCAKNEEELLLLNHYSNIQPLCSYTNRVLKSNNIPKVCNIVKKEINKINE